MAFTLEDKNKIIFHLGHPAKTLDINSLEFNTIINSRFENLSTDAEDLILSLVADLDAIRVKIQESRCRMSTKQVGDITLNSDNEAILLRKELRRLAKELSRLINIAYVGPGNSARVRY